jgi:outer membrane immunogenic protein
MRMRRRFLLASVASSALGLATAASAADMPVYLKAPPPAWNWTGFYLGGNVGYSWGNSNSTVTFLDNTTGAALASVGNSFGMDGVIGGGQIGYNWQRGNWVWGLETDIQASGQQGSATFACGPACGVPAVTETLTEKLDWFGTVRGRLGFTVTPTVLLYGTGGLAYGDIQTSGSIADPTTFSTSSVKAGWTVGAGVEARIVGNWTAKIEYLYMDLGSVSGATSTPDVVVPAPTGSCGFANFPSCSAHTLNSSFNSGITDNILRVGVNYKFN